MKIKKRLKQLPFQQGDKDRILDKTHKNIQSNKMCSEEYKSIAQDATKTLEVCEAKVKTQKRKNFILKIVCANIAVLIIIVSIFGFNLGNVQNTFSGYVPKFIECHLSKTNSAKSIAQNSYISAPLLQQVASLELVILVENQQKDSIRSVTIWDSQVDKEVVFTQDSQKYKILSSEMQNKDGVYITTIVLGIPPSEVNTPRTLDIREIQYFRKRLIGSDLSGAVSIPDKSKAQITFTANNLSYILGRNEFCKTD